MESKMKAYTEMSKKKYELDEKLEEVEVAKDAYREAILDETISEILNIVNKEGKLTERDLRIFLSSLSVSTKQIYSR